MGGAGRLTNEMANTIQNFYSRAIRVNKGDAKKMSKATHAILKHYSSTPEEPKHDDCPTGPNSWCSYQRDEANRTNRHKPIKNPLPDAVVEAMQPLFDRLGNDTFLVGCENCYTQNRNECLQQMIWGMASKEMFSSPQEISLAISLGALHFSQGFNATYSQLVPELDIQVQPKMCESWRKIDLDRIYQADYRSTTEVQKRRKKKRKEKLRKRDAFVHQEGMMYQWQAFYGGETGSGSRKKAKTQKASKTSETVWAKKKNKKAGQNTKKGSKKATKSKSQTKK